MKNKIAVVLLILATAVVAFVLLKPEDGGPSFVVDMTKGLSPAPNFVLPSLAGGEIKLSEYLGRKPVILDFWTTWCLNCRRSMPRLNEWYKTYKNELEVIGVNIEEEPETVRRFIAERGIVFPIALDRHGEVKRLYNINYTNVHALINKQGQIARIIFGDITEEYIKALIIAK
ncbi:MAG: TlpA family protein disulfide reductase [Candidatus Taylorbacteria bacterium]|nr:TlpA family protein disulfide reductase [Candidatus Taylorbacteria bacterium]